MHLKKISENTVSANTNDINFINWYKSMPSENVICYCLWVDGKILKHLKKTGGKN